MKKILVADAMKCTGCRECEVVCSVVKEGVSNPSRARVHVIRWNAISLEMPMVCQQCESPLCATVCPTEALNRNEELGTMEIDYNRCIGCRMCVSACPFGGVGFDPVGKKVTKCDLCGGDPMCVKFCYTNALEYVDANALNVKKKREAAERLNEWTQRFGVGTPA